MIEGVVLSVRSILVCMLILSGCQEATQSLCPILPMTLNIDSPDGKFTLFRVDSNGKVFLSKPFRIDEIAQLHSDGCLIGFDQSKDKREVWVERTSRGKFWTQHQEFSLQDERLKLGNHDLWIDTQGKVVKITDDKREPTGIVFSGYRPEGRCAAQMLLVAYMAMLPSMAVADGVARELPSPKHSLCRKKLLK